jgi:alpha-galactosidase
MKLFLFAVCHIVYLTATAQIDSIILENKKISRTFFFGKDSGNFYSASFINKATGDNYINPGSEEFSVKVNGKIVNGRNCKLLTFGFSRLIDTTRLIVRLQTPISGVFVQLTYDTYVNLPVVRKGLDVVNETQSEIVLSDLDVEQLRFEIVNQFNNEIYSNYGTHLSRLPFKGDYNDAVVMLYNPQFKQGAIFGNEAPSLLKSTELYTNTNDGIEVGMKHLNEQFPFKKFLAGGATFRNPRTFIYLFTSSEWQDGFEGEYKNFTRKYLGIRLNQRAKPLSVYGTWLPFLDKIDDKLVRQLADKLSNTATDIFIIDPGWYVYSGDFREDTSAFPKGLASTCQYIRNKGMQVGLWFTVAGVNLKSQVAMQHPDWLIKDKDGNPMNIHDMAAYPDGKAWYNALKSMSIGSPYYYHLKNIISTYINTLGIKYIMLDLSIVASAYVHDQERSGDFESNPTKLYKDRASSYWTMYEQMMRLMDELHAAFPGLFIDCTFEVWGRYNVADFALIQHADFEWLANIEMDPIRSSIAVRQLNFDRGRAIPNGGFLIGNLFLNSPNYKYEYFSLACSNIAMVGDATLMTEEQRTFYFKWNRFLKLAEKKYHYSQFFQLYDVFERPSDQNWDGCYRINTELQEGLMFFFRSNSADSHRIFKIPCLNRKNSYKIYSPDSGKIIGVYKGSFLIEHGIRISIADIYSGLVLCIEKM